MRTLKFRAWDIDAKRMIHNVIVGMARQLKTIVITGYEVDFEEIDFEATEYTTNNEKSVYQIMQFTGLTDKNDKEIYEGDIVKTTGCSKSRINDKFEVIFQVGAFQLLCIGIDDKPIAFITAAVQIKENLEFDLNIESLPKYFEIIGNIYENPELLK